MEEKPKKRMGRPPGKQANWKPRTVLLTEQEDAWARELAQRRNLSVAALVRDLLDTEAARLGLAACRPAPRGEEE